MAIPIFLSYPKPHSQIQFTFISKLCDSLKNKGMEHRTLGVNEYDMGSPLKAIRRLMLESDGLIVIAFKRLYIERGTYRYDPDLTNILTERVESLWLTSPYCQIEPAMAYQLRLPILVLREQGVRPEGILEQGIVGTYIPEFSLDEHASNYFESPEWQALFKKWESQVRVVVNSKRSTA